MPPGRSFALVGMIKRFHANQARLRRHRRIRRFLKGNEERPRLNVFRSGQHIYAQVIDDTTGRTLAAASSLDESLRNFQPPVQQEQQAAAQPSVAEPVEEAPARKGKGAKGGRVATQEKPATETKKSSAEALAAIAHNRKVALAREVGKLVGQRALEKGVTRVVFDRGGYAYHGRVASLAEGAREAGLSF